jgi:hypothetical protein
VESKSLTIEWGGFGKVIAPEQHLSGSGNSNFEIIGGSNCVGEPPNGEYSSTRKTCTETVRLKNAVKGLSVTLEVTNQYDILKVKLTS